MMVMMISSVNIFLHFQANIFLDAKRKKQKKTRAKK